MLKMQKTVNYFGQSLEPRTDTQIASMVYSIDSNGTVNTSTNISNQELYEKHKEMVRTDIDTFMDRCRNAEDTDFDEEEVTE